MLCYKCQREIPENSLICPLCGAELSEAAKKQYENGEAPKMSMPYTPMNWFKFLIYFMLFADALIAIGNAYSFFTGDVYSIQTLGEVTSDVIYAQYGTALRIIDIIYALSFLAFAVLTIISRYRLAKFKKDGPVFFYIAYIFSIVIALGYGVAVNIISGIDPAALSVSLFSMAPQLVFIYLNYIYFKKRKHLFVN